MIRYAAKASLLELQGVCDCALSPHIVHQVRAASIVAANGTFAVLVAHIVLRSLVGYTSYVVHLFLARTIGINTLETVS
jgi:hypothetical protein